LHPPKRLTPKHPVLFDIRNISWAASLAAYAICADLEVTSGNGLSPTCLGSWISGPLYASPFVNTNIADPHYLPGLIFGASITLLRTELFCLPSESMNHESSGLSSKRKTRMVTRQTCKRSDAPSNQLSFQLCSTVLCTHTCGMPSISLLKSNCRNASSIKQLQNMLPTTRHRLTYLLKYLID
jgi:hypothetical protein